MTLILLSKVEAAIGRAVLRQRRLDADTEEAAAADTRRRRGRPTLAAQIANQADAAAWRQAWRDGDDISDDDMQAALTERRAQDRADGNYAALPTEDLRKIVNDIQKTIKDGNITIDTSASLYDQQMQGVRSAERNRKLIEKNPDAFKEYWVKELDGVADAGAVDFVIKTLGLEAAAVLFERMFFLPAAAADAVVVGGMTANDAYLQANKDEFVKRARKKPVRTLDEITPIAQRVAEEEAKLARIQKIIKQRAGNNR